MAGRGLICVSVMAEEPAGILAAATPLAELADVVEIRLDGLSEPRLGNWITTIPKPVLATNRPVWEGGRFTGSEEERIEGLCAALRFGVRYVDIELRTGMALRARVLHEARLHGTQVIVSSHDFEHTPPTEHLRATLKEMVASGADIGKIVTTAASPADALRVLALQQEAMAAGFPLSAFAMGAAGTISRLATLYLGGFMTYAAPAPEQATAPGQITVRDLHALLRLLDARS
jgi:3-dehydroquinate dehydratase-1/3-dehydroquinate dehydratase/shikimate dehydrogenase